MRSKYRALLSTTRIGASLLKHVFVPVVLTVRCSVPVGSDDMRITWLTGIMQLARKKLYCQRSPANISKPLKPVRAACTFSNIKFSQEQAGPLAWRLSWSSLCHSQARAVRSQDTNWLTMNTFRRFSSVSSLLFRSMLAPSKLGRKGGVAVSVETRLIAGRGWHLDQLHTYWLMREPCRSIATTFNYKQSTLPTELADKSSRMEVRDQ